MELLIMESAQAYVGVPTSDVKEVVRAARIAPPPKANAHVKGLLNLRGKIVPVIALRRLLGMEDRDIVPTDHFIVLQTESTTFALHVDRAIEILNVPDPTSDTADPTLASSVPHERLGVIQIHRASELRTRLGLSSSAATAQSEQRNKKTSSP